MILLFWLFVWFGINGLGAGAIAYLLLIYAGDRFLARREMARFDQMGGGYVHGPDDYYGPDDLHRPLRLRLRPRKEGDS